MHFSQLRRCGASLLVALSAPVASLAAQAATVTGHVTNAGGQPLAGVTVSITGMGLGAITRDDGLYTFTVPAARVTGQVANLNARRVGYSPQNVAITLNAGTITHDFVMTQTAAQLEEIIVTGSEIGRASCRERV